MSGLLIKPGDKSKIFLKGHLTSNGSYILSRSAINATSLNVGLSDFAIMLDAIPPKCNSYTYVIQKAGATGYQIRWGGTDVVRFELFGGGVTINTPGITFGQRHRLWFFVDRDGNLYVYDNGVLVNTQSVVAGNVDQDVAQPYYLNYDGGSQTYRSGNLLGVYHWNFGVGGIPDAATRQAIVNQDTANPYTVSPILLARPGSATEERLRITFDNLDPSWAYVTDDSPQNNDLTFYGANTVGTCCKEFMQPSHIMTPDDGPQYGMRFGRCQGLPITTIPITATDDVIVEVIIKNRVKDRAFQIMSGAANGYPYYFQLRNIAAVTYLLFHNVGIEPTGFRILSSDASVNDWIYSGRMFDGYTHVWFILTQAAITYFINGHNMRTVAKPGYIIDVDRIVCGSPYMGQYLPGTVIAARTYKIPHASHPGDAALLEAHRKAFVYPFITPSILLPYEVIKTTFRQPNGSAILDSDTNVYNEKTGEALPLVGGLANQWGEIKDQIWQPR